MQTMVRWTAIAVTSYSRRSAMQTVVCAGVNVYKRSEEQVGDPKE